MCRKSVNTLQGILLSYGCLNTKNNKDYADLGVVFMGVEVERFELSSKRGNNMLSTCLSPLRLSGAYKTGATNMHLSP